MIALAELGTHAAALDLRGHGLSEGREQLQSWRIDDYVSDVLAVLCRWETLRILVGHSMGGLIAQLAAMETQLDRLVLVASSPSKGMLRDGFRMSIAHPWTFTVAYTRRSFDTWHVRARWTQRLNIDTRGVSAIFWTLPDQSVFSPCAGVKAPDIISPSKTFRILAPVQ